MAVGSYPATTLCSKRIWKGKNTFLATYENRGIWRYFPRKSFCGRYASVRDWRMGRDGEGRVRTERDGTGRKGMVRHGEGRDGKERNGKGWRGTGQPTGYRGTGRVERDGTA